MKLDQKPEIYVIQPIRITTISICVLGCLKSNKNFEEILLFFGIKVVLVVVSVSFRDLVDINHQPLSLRINFTNGNIYTDILKGNREKLTTTTQEQKLQFLLLVPLHTLHHVNNKVLRNSIKNRNHSQNNLSPSTFHVTTQVYKTG